MSQTVVAIFMVVAFLLISGLDLWLEHDKVKNNTYSEQFRKWGKIFPPLKMLVCVFFGLLLGHWYWTVTEYVYVNCK